MLFLRKCLINGYPTLWSLDYHCMLSGSLFISFSFYGVGDWTHGPMHARQMLCCWAHLGMEKLFLHYALISEEVSKIVISDSGLCLLDKFVTKVTMWHLGSQVRLWAAASAFVLASVLWGVGARVFVSQTEWGSSHLSSSVSVVSSFPYLMHSTLRLYHGFTSMILFPWVICVNDSWQFCT